MGNEVAVQLTVRLLGTPDARIAGAPLVLHHQKARAILYYLAATGRPHTRDHLATLLWSESPESNARHSLRSSLYHLRQALHAKGAGEMLAGVGTHRQLGAAAFVAATGKHRVVAESGFVAVAFDGDDLAFLSHDPELLGEAAQETRV